jgi:uncharacterized protein YcbK (DUF882 family)
VALLLALGSPVAAGSSGSSGDPRTLWLYNIHTREELRIRPFGPYGRPEELAWRRLNRFFRSWRTTQRRSVHPRLLRTLARIQQHFGGRRLDIVSGYRVPANPDALSSYHQVGRGADLRIEGVDNRVLFDYCRTLQAVGCGYYPSGHHVHVDVRGNEGVWVDLSLGGEPAQYAGDARAWLRRN